MSAGKFLHSFLRLIRRHFEGKPAWVASLKKKIRHAGTDFPWKWRLRSEDRAQKFHTDGLVTTHIRLLFLIGWKSAETVYSWFTGHQYGISAQAGIPVMARCPRRMSAVYIMLPSQHWTRDPWRSELSGVDCIKQKKQGWFNSRVPTVIPALLLLFSTFKNIFEPITDSIIY